MRSNKRILFIGAAAVCAWPLAASAQESGTPAIVTTSSVEIGVGAVSEDSFKFGEYNGLEDGGAFFIGNLDITQRSAYDSDDTRYVEFLGENIGLASQSFYMEAGRQGSFKIFGEWNQIPHNAIDDAQTPFRGAGTDDLTLPTGWIPAGDADDLDPDMLAANLTDLEVKTERDRLGAGVSWNINKQWGLSANFRREEKTGVDTIAAGGRPAIMPKPIDYVTQEAGLALSYASDRLQGELRYQLSVFDNQNDSLTFDTAFNNDPDNFYGADPLLGEWGRSSIGLEPDNSAHQLSLSGGYVVSPTTRVAGSFSYGRMFQDDDFLPYTINPNLLAGDGVSPLVPLPRDSLDGQVNTMHGGLSFTTRPTQATDIRAEYTFDKRDNATPRDVYLRVSADAANQSAIDGSNARLNMPHSRQSHKVELDGGYRLTDSMKLSLGYDFETINRDHSEVEDTYEHTGRVKLQVNPTDSVSGSLEYAYSTRTGSTYKSNLPWLESHTPEYQATQTLPDDSYENNPYLRKYYFADRVRNLLTGRVTVMPSDFVTVGLGASYDKSDYNDTVIGLTASDYMSGTVDLALTPSNRLTIDGFVTYEHMANDQTGYEAGGTLPGEALDPDELWQEDSTDRAISAGIGAEWVAVVDKLKFGLDYTYSNTKTEYDLSSPGVALTPLPLPDLTSELHSVGLTADYNLQSDIILRLGYRFERYDSKDFALDGVDENDVPGTLVLGESAPDYDVHVIGASMVVKF